MNPVLHSLLPAFSMALLLLGGLAPLNNRWLPPLATATLLECVAFLVPMAVFGVIQRRLGTPLRMRLRLAPPRFWPLTFFVAGAVSLLSFFLNYLMALATGGALLEGTTYDAVSRFGGAPGWLLVLALALLPALVEELFFRGALLSGLEKWGQGAAILVSSLCFALVHGSAANFLGPLVAGLLFGYLTVITGSLWPAVVGHLCNTWFICGWAMCSNGMPLWHLALFSADHGGSVVRVYLFGRFFFGAAGGKRARAPLKRGHRPLGGCTKAGLPGRSGYGGPFHPETCIAVSKAGRCINAYHRPIRGGKTAAAPEKNEKRKTKPAR